MELKQFKKLLKELDEPYYDSKYLQIMLEKFYHKNFAEIKDMVSNYQITVTADDIQKFLDEKFIEEEPETLNRLIKRQKEYEEYMQSDEIKSGKWRETMFDNPWWADKKQIEEHCNRFADECTAARYSFEPFTLEYFHKYSNIVRKKALLLLSIIENIDNEEKEYEELRNKYDIVLNQNKEVAKEDFERLLVPTVYNIDKLISKVNDANNLSTYLTFKMSPFSLGREGISENEIYPSKSLQIVSIHDCHRPGNIPLSKRQKEELDRQMDASREACAKSLFGF